MPEVLPVRSSLADRLRECADRIGMSNTPLGRLLNEAADALSAQQEQKQEAPRFASAQSILRLPSEGQWHLRNMDTPDNRRFWRSVDRAVADWERNKPDWVRKLEAEHANEAEN